MRHLDLDHIVNMLAAEKLVVKHFENELQSFFQFSEKRFLCFMVFYYSTALISTKNIIELF